MSATLKADGDTWRVRLGGTGQEPVVLFFCVTTDQRPYRVVRVAHGRFSDGAELDALSADDLRALFQGSRSLGAPVEYPSYGP